MARINLYRPIKLMTTQKSQNAYNLNISEDVTLMKYQIIELKSQQDRIETKIDHFVSVSPADFLAHRLEVDKGLATKADKATVDLLKKIVFTACGIILAAVLYASLSTIGLKR